MTATIKIHDPFAMEASNRSPKEYELLPQGAYPATIFGILDLGTHNETFEDGKKGKQRKCCLLLEISTSVAKMKDGSPFFFAKVVNISSLGKKAAIRSIAEAVLGRTFADKEAVNLRSLLDGSCTANITNSEGGKEKKIYANLKSISALSVGVPPVVGVMDRVVWFHGCEAPFPDEEWMPWNYGQKFIDVYRDSDEYRSIHGGPAGGADVTYPASKADFVGDEIPF